MGRDKALIELPGSGLLLWQRQWKVLEDLQPEEMLWSGPPRPQMPDRARVIPDVVKNAGPLAGISACLDELRSDLLVVLAVDLPEMSAAFLRGPAHARHAGLRGRREARGFLRADGRGLPATTEGPGLRASRAGALRDAGIHPRGGAGAGAHGNPDRAGRERVLFKNWNAPVDLPTPNNVSAAST